MPSTNFVLHSGGREPRHLKVTAADVGRPHSGTGLQLSTGSRPRLGSPGAACSPVSLSARWPCRVPSGARPLSDLQCWVANGRENKRAAGRSPGAAGGPMPTVLSGRRGRASALAPASPFITLPLPQPCSSAGTGGGAAILCPPSIHAPGWRRGPAHSSARDDPSVRPPARTPRLPDAGGSAQGVEPRPHPQPRPSLQRGGPARCRAVPSLRCHRAAAAPRLTRAAPASTTNSPGRGGWPPGETG